MLLKYFEFLCSKSADIFLLHFLAFASCLERPSPSKSRFFLALLWFHFLKNVYIFKSNWDYVDTWGEVGNQAYVFPDG